MRWLDGITDSMDTKCEQTPGDSEGQGRLVCCSPQDRKESDMTEQLHFNAFELCWRRLLRVPWTARRSNQSIQKLNSPGVHWKD